MRPSHVQGKQPHVQKSIVSQNLTIRGLDGRMMDELSLLAKHSKNVDLLGNMGESVGSGFPLTIVTG